MTEDDLSAPPLLPVPPSRAADVAALEAEFAGSGWVFGTVWQSANSGPETRNLTARLGCVLLADGSAAGLAEKIRHEEERPA